GRDTVERALRRAEVGVTRAVGLELLPERERGGPGFLAEVLGRGDGQREVLDLDVEGLRAAPQQLHAGSLVRAADGSGSARGNDPAAAEHLVAAGAHRALTRRA